MALASGPSRPMPQWEAGDDKVGNVGGSGTAVLKGCDTPEAAWTSRTS